MKTKKRKVKVAHAGDTFAVPIREIKQPKEVTVREMGNGFTVHNGMYGPGRKEMVATSEDEAFAHARKMMGRLKPHKKREKK